MRDVANWRTQVALATTKVRRKLHPRPIHGYQIFSDPAVGAGAMHRREALVDPEWKPAGDRYALSVLDWARRINIQAILYAFLPFAILLAYTRLLRASGGIVFSQWAVDIFIPLEGALHLQAGHWPHRDFSTPVGSLWYVIHYLPTLVSPLSAQTVIWANLIIATAAAAAMLCACAGKMPRYMASLAAIYAGLLALSPRQIGTSFEHLSNNASYNRHCWALISAIAVAALLVPRKASVRRDVLDGVVAGILIAMCFYIKATYAAAGIAFLGLSIVTVRGLKGWRFAVSALLTALLTGGAAALLTGDLEPYLVDLRTAVAVLPHATRSTQAAALFSVELPDFIVVGLLGSIATATGSRLLGRLTPATWAALGTVFAGLAIGVQNHPEPENPLMAIALLVTWFGNGTNEREHLQKPRTEQRIARRAGAIAAILALCIPIARDVRSAAYAASTPVDRSAATTWLASTAMPDLHIAAVSSSPDEDSDAAIFSRWHEGIRLLQAHLQGRKDVTVLPLTWSNPLPALLGIRPVSGEVTWWDAKRTFNRDHKPEAKKLFGAVDYILVPHGFVNPDTAEEMEAAYGREITTGFQPVGRTTHWTLLARTDCSLHALC